MHAEKTVSDVVVEELVVGHCSVVKQVHENDIIGAECASNVGVWEVVDWHCEVIHPV